MNEEEKIVSTADRIIKLWPIVALLVGGISGYLQLKWTVADIKSDMDSFQENVQQHRKVQADKDKEEEHRFTAIEKDLEWLKKEK